MNGIMKPLMVLLFICKFIVFGGEHCDTSIRYWPGSFQAVAPTKYCLLEGKLDGEPLRSLAPFQHCFSCKCCNTSAAATCPPCACCFGIDCQLRDKALEGLTEEFKAKQRNLAI